MPINIRLLQTEISTKAARQLEGTVRSVVRAEFEEHKDEFFEDFETDPVVQELEAGPDLEKSAFIPAGKGNLFSLLGFYAEQDPIAALRSYLKRKIRLGDTRKGKLRGRTITYLTPVEMPTISDIDAAMASDDKSTLASWSPRSFTNLIASGITGLSHYLFDKTRDFSHIPSRSGPAIQTKGTALRADGVGPIPFLGPLLASLRRRIEGTRR